MILRNKLFKNNNKTSNNNKNNQAGIQQNNICRNQRNANRRIKKEKENHYGNHRENETGWQKKVFVTGAAKGIGKCTATAFAEAGADVAIVDLDFEEAQKTAKELAEKTGRKIIAIKTDCTDKEQVDAI